MQIGDLVKNIYTGEIYIVTSRVPDHPMGGDYVEVDSQWAVPLDHLEVICE